MQNIPKSCYARAVVTDCDVDAPGLHMLLHPEIIETKEFRGSKIAVIERLNVLNAASAEKNADSTP